MKAVQIDQYGGIDVLQVREIPKPEPKAGEVVIAVRAAGINPGEAAIRSGAFGGGVAGLERIRAWALGEGRCLER